MTTATPTDESRVLTRTEVPTPTSGICGICFRTLANGRKISIGSSKPARRLRNGKDGSVLGWALAGLEFEERARSKDRTFVHFLLCS
jgi:hypothetical protein